MLLSTWLFVLLTAGTGAALGRVVIEAINPGAPRQCAGPHSQLPRIPLDAGGAWQGGSSGSPGAQWELHPSWRDRKLAVVMPVMASREAWVRASRAWRKGVRAVLVGSLDQPIPAVAEARRHAETYLRVSDRLIPFGIRGKAALAPALAHDALEGDYEWLLYGDDDTMWMMDAVPQLVKDLDPDEPHLVTDHYWFWGYGGREATKHPHPWAPRCVPCNRDDEVRRALDARWTALAQADMQEESRTRMDKSSGGKSERTIETDTAKSARGAGPDRGSASGPDAKGTGSVRSAGPGQGHSPDRNISTISATSEGTTTEALGANSTTSARSLLALGFQISTATSAKSPPFYPPGACPRCTWSTLCRAMRRSANRGQPALDVDAICSPSNDFVALYPEAGELIAHGGAGMLLSVGLMRMLTTSYLRQCLSKSFANVTHIVPGGDTLFSHCAFFTGIAPTDPGWSFLEDPWSETKRWMRYTKREETRKRALEAAYGGGRSLLGAESATEGGLGSRNEGDGHAKAHRKGRELDEDKTQEGEFWDSETQDGNTSVVKAASPPPPRGGVFSIFRLKRSPTHEGDDATPPVATRGTVEDVDWAKAKREKDQDRRRKNKEEEKKRNKKMGGADADSDAAENAVASLSRKSSTPHSSLSTSAFDAGQTAVEVSAGASRGATRHNGAKDVSLFSSTAGDISVSLRPSGERSTGSSEEQSVARYHGADSASSRSVSDLPSPDDSPSNSLMSVVHGILERAGLGGSQLPAVSEHEPPLRKYVLVDSSDTGADTTHMTVWVDPLAPDDDLDIEAVNPFGVLHATTEIKEQLFKPRLDSMAKSAGTAPIARTKQDDEDEEAGVETEAASAPRKRSGSLDLGGSKSGGDPTADEGSDGASERKASPLRTAVEGDPSTQVSSSTMPTHWSLEVGRGDASGSGSRSAVSDDSRRGRSEENAESGHDAASKASSVVSAGSGDDSSDSQDDIEPADPSTFPIRLPGILPDRSFDAGGQDVLAAIAEHYRALRKGCCDDACWTRLRRTATVHLRSAHFRHPDSGPWLARQLGELRDLYLAAREIPANRDPPPEGWDAHRSCE